LFIAFIASKIYQEIEPFTLRIHIINNLFCDSYDKDFGSDSICIVIFFCTWWIGKCRTERDFLQKWVKDISGCSLCSILRMIFAISGTKLERIARVRSIKDMRRIYVVENPRSHIWRHNILLHVDDLCSKHFDFFFCVKDKN
jgi:hypothetical protein